MSNIEMSTILQQLRRLLAEEIQQKYMPLHVCKQCDNLAEGALVERIVATVRGNND